MGMGFRPNKIKKQTALFELENIIHLARKNEINELQSKMRIFNLKKKYRLGKVEDLL